MAKPTLVLVYETEAACRARLLLDGMSSRHAIEVSSYLAQSTDLAVEFDTISKACAAEGLKFVPVELDAFGALIPSLDRAETLIWALTDGIAYFRGGVAPALARLAGLTTIGSDDSLFALCQDKFRTGAVLGALGLPTPQAGLARGGTWIVEPPEAPLGWFVKPNRLGAKIGIWPDSHCRSRTDALNLSQRIYAAYGDEALVQPYVPGRNARASFLAIDPSAGTNDLGIAFVDSGHDFQTMADSMALYGDTGSQAALHGTQSVPELEAVAISQPDADGAIRLMCSQLMQGLGLRDVFSLDLRIEPNGTVHLIEFEVCPGLPCFDFRSYCQSQYGVTLAEAMARTARARLAP